MCHVETFVLNIIVLILLNYFLHSYLELVVSVCFITFLFFSFKDKEISLLDPCTKL